MKNYLTFQTVWKSQDDEIQGNYFRTNKRRHIHSLFGFGFISQKERLFWQRHGTKHLVQKSQKYKIIQNLALWLLS